MSDYPSPKRTVQLTSVPETMIWAVYNRAEEALRPGGCIQDPDAIRIYRSIDYEYQKRFGPPDEIFAVRSVMFDAILRNWIAEHPNGLVVALGEGLETQSIRVDNGRIRWLSVDLPEAIEVREQFLPATERFRNVSVSALDFSWMDLVDNASEVLINAQGLLMYFPPAEVQRLVQTIAERFPNAEFIFDTIPQWFSKMTMTGVKKTKHYQLPPMPWGIDADEIEATLQNWCPSVSVEVIRYQYNRPLRKLFMALFEWIPGLKSKISVIVHAQFKGVPIQ